MAFVGEDGSDFGGVRREWYSLVTQVFPLFTKDGYQDFFWISITFPLPYP